MKNKFDFKILMWLPTLRRHKDKHRNDTGTTSYSDLPFFEQFEQFMDINDYLQKNGYKLIIKPHPSQDLCFFKKINLSNIKIITNEDLQENNIHLYELLSISEALITDYSSVYVDYLLTNKMIAFTLEDYVEFKNNKGFLVDDPTKYMPGHKLYDIEDLKTFIEDVIDNNDIYVEERKKVLKLFHENVDSLSTKRVYSFILRKMED